jgi:lipid-binding SYLF domain-containing protein
MKQHFMVRPTRIFIWVSALSLLVVMGGFLSGQAVAKSAREIDVSVNVAIDRFYKKVANARKLVQSAKGMLVMPNVVKAGFIIGGEYGEGALRIGGKTVDYYNIAAGSFGLQIGGQAMDIILLFMENDALNDFRASDGWEVGVDGNVALITVGAGETATTTLANKPILGFVLDVKGLMADISIKGSKFSKIER